MVARRVAVAGIGRDMTPLTVDEARAALVSSAVDCLRTASCGPAGLHAMLLGRPGHASWSVSDQAIAREHRAVLESVCGNGHGWVVLDELEGIIDATGVAHDDLRDVDVIEAQAGASASTGALMASST